MNRERSLNALDWEALAFREGHKTQLRIPIRRLGARGLLGSFKDGVATFGDSFPDDPVPCLIKAPWLPGDALRVREAWAPSVLDPEFEWDPCTGENCHAVHRADGDGGGWERYEVVRGKVMREKIEPTWLPASRMPRWAARTWLLVAGIRPERLHAATPSDARAMGLRNFGAPGSGRGCWWVRHDGLARAGATAKAGLALRWDEDHGSGAWSTNPWVWRVVVKLDRERSGLARAV